MVWFCLLVMHVCKKWFLAVFWVVSVDICLVYGLGFVHMICSCLMVMHVPEKWFLAVFYVVSVKLCFV